MVFHGNSLSKSLSISNIAGYAEPPRVYVVMVDVNDLVTFPPPSSASAGQRVLIFFLQSHV